MASYASIGGSGALTGSLKHDLRERASYNNKDIDPTRTHLNETLSDHGSNSQECTQYFHEITKDFYYRGGDTTTSGQIICTLPVGLASTRDKEFFESSKEFFDNYLFAGDDRRCILAQVHRDESGQSHMHYTFTFPEVENKKYISFDEKFDAGISAAEIKLERRFSENERSEIKEIVNQFEQISSPSREKDAIHKISETLNIKRDDARWVFTRVRRLKSEIYEKRLMSKDEFLTKDFFDRLHPEYQKWIDRHGPKCTVYRGGGNIEFSIEEMKEMRKIGVTKEQLMEVQQVTHTTLIKTKEYAELQKLRDRIRNLEKSRSSERDRSWGDLSGWGKSKGEITWEK